MRINQRARIGTDEVCSSHLVESQTTRALLGDGHRDAAVTEHAIERHIRRVIDGDGATNPVTKVRRTCKTQCFPCATSHREGRAAVLSEAAELRLSEGGAIEIDCRIGRDIRRIASAGADDHGIIRTPCRDGRRAIYLRREEHRGRNRGLRGTDIQASAARVRQNCRATAGALAIFQHNIVMARS